MEILRTKVSSKFITLCLLLIIILLLLHNSFHSEFVTRKPAVLHTTPYESENRVLQGVLKRASTSNRLVILTFVDNVSAKEGSTLDLFLESLRIGERTQPWLHHTVVITEDGQAFKYCISVHPHCFLLRKISLDESTRKGFTRFTSSKIDLLERVIKFGYAIIFTSVDMMWLRNPMYELNPVSQMTMLCDPYDSNVEHKTGIKRDAPFFYAQSDAMVLEFTKYWNLIRVLHPKTQQRALCEMSLYSDISQQLGMEISFLKKDNFWEICQPTMDFTELYAINAECCDSLDNKVHDLKLVLPDMKNLGVYNSSILSIAHLKCKA